MDAVDFVLYPSIGAAAWFWFLADMHGVSSAWKHVARHGSVVALVALVVLVAFDIGSLRSQPRLASTLTAAAAVHVGILAGAALSHIGWHFTLQFERNRIAKRDAAFNQEARP